MTTLHAAEAMPTSVDHSRAVVTPLRQIRALYYLFFPGSGIARYTHELLRHFVESMDVSVELACLPSYHWLQQAPYRVWPGLREIAHPSPLRRRMRFVSAQLINPLRLVRRARQMDVDVVHLCNINHLTFPLWGRLLNRTGAKLAITVHDVRRTKAMLNRRYEDRQLAAVYRRADALFVHSHAQTEDLIAFAGVPAERVHIVPHGPYNYGVARMSREESRRQLGWPLDKQVALFFGNIRDDKNLDLLLRALASNKGRVHMAVVGRGGGGKHRGIADYRQLAQALGVADAVTFDDRYIPDEEVPELFNACDWVTLPYSATFTSQSGVLNVAAWYRRPVLASAAGTFAETLMTHDLGVLVEPDDERALSKGIQQIIGRIERSEAFAFEPYLNKHSWSQNVDLTVRVYQEISGLMPHACDPIPTIPGCQTK